MTTIRSSISTSWRTTPRSSVITAARIRPTTSSPRPRRRSPSDRTPQPAYRDTSPPDYWRALSSLAHPGGGERADQQQEAEQAREHRQHADAAHHAGIAHLQPDPVLAAIGVARSHGDDARQRHARTVRDAARAATGLGGERSEHLRGGGDLGKFARVGRADIDQRIKLAVGRAPQPKLV